MANYLKVITDPDMVDMSEIFECPCCGGHIALDNTYLDQVKDYIACPYCKNKVHEPIEIESASKFDYPPDKFFVFTETQKDESGSVTRKYVINSYNQDEVKRRWNKYYSDNDYDRSDDKWYSEDDGNYELVKIEEVSKEDYEVLAKHIHTFGDVFQ